MRYWLCHGDAESHIVPVLLRERFLLTIVRVFGLRRFGNERVCESWQ